MIPNKIHFIYGLTSDFGDMPFGIIHYLAIRSAHEVNQPVDIFFHCKHVPDTVWWHRAKPFVVVRHVDPPKQIFRNPLYSYAHKADVLRLEILMREGGIYLDIDTICVKPFTPLLNHSMVLGIEEKKDGSIKGLGNSVMLAEKTSKFLQIWYAYYHVFRGTELGKPFWAEHSVALPYSLSMQGMLADHIHIEPATSFLTPGWDNLRDLFKNNKQYPHAYCHHLWESLAYRKHLAPLTVRDIIEKDTTYNWLARKYVREYKSLPSDNNE